MYRAFRPLAATALLAGGFLAGCRPQAPERLAFPSAPVVIVSVDTLRSDHLPAYGYAGVETPTIDALRKDAILFERAYAQVPLTLPSHASLFTGLLPAAHGVHDNLGYRLKAGTTTLAEALKKAGYATGGAVSTVVLNAGSGVGRGFDLYEDAVEPKQPGQALGRVQRSGEQTEALLGAWLEGLPQGPFLAFLHLYEPHTPYEPPEPHASRYRDRPYDGEIAHADALVGRFLDRLRAKGLYDGALVVFLSDHGEGLGEHGEDEHGIFLYRWALQVPLLVKLPGGKLGGTSVAAPVALTDLAGTIASAVGAPSLSAAPGSADLLALAGGAAAPERRLFAETFYPRLHFGWADTSSLIDGTWHYIDAPRAELYDLAADPAERKDLAPALPPPFRALRIEMEKLRAAFEAPGAVDPEEKAKLASLGYLSAGVAETGGPLPDAKDEIGVVRQLKEGSGLFHRGKYPEAIAVFRELLEKNPRMLDVWDLLSQSLQRMGRSDEALAALKKGVELSPAGSSHYLVAVANLALQLARYEEAQKHAEIAKERGDPSADDVLARVHLSRREWDAAEKAALASLEARKSRRLPYLVLARVAVVRGDLPKALELVDKVGAMTAGSEAMSFSGYHYLRGDVLGRLGRTAEAEAEFLEEIRQFPGNLEARCSLAALYASQGDLAKVRGTIEAMVRDNPGVESYVSAAQTLSVVGDEAGAAHFRRAGLARYPTERRLKRGA